jgi:hypothetical protein
MARAGLKGEMSWKARCLGKSISEATALSPIERTHRALLAEVAVADA